LDNNFGKCEAAVNALLVYLKDEIRVKNAADIVLDGDPGAQFKIALTEVKTDPGLMQRFTSKVRDVCRELGESCKTYGMTSRVWGNSYDNFIDRLRMLATQERAAREGAAAQ
jgi:hypothetical protein